MFIVNNERNIIFGESSFYKKYGFNPVEILEYLKFNNDTDNEKLVMKINHKENTYLVNYEKFNDNEKQYWIVKFIKDYTETLEFEFIVDSNYIIKKWYPGNISDNTMKSGLTINYFDSECYEGKHIIELSHQLYEYIKNLYDTEIMTIKNNKTIQPNKLIFKEKIIEINDFHMLAIIFYDIDNNNFKIICKNINLIIKDKISTVYENTSLSKKNFISHIFHEVRNYLNVIMLASNNLLQETTENINIAGSVNENFSTSIKYISDINDASNTIKDILSDVLSIEKIKHSNISIHLRKFMLNDLFDKCVYIMNSHLNTKEIIFNHHNLISGNISIIADYIKLKQVIINLLTNAVKFTREKGHVSFIVKEETIVELNQEYKYIVFEIIDDGIGIQDKYKDKLFKPFEQINARQLQQGGGTGLGLSISKHIIEKHKGEIGFNSIYKKGSTFYFKIPRISPENEFYSGNDKQDIIETTQSFEFIKPENKQSININEHNILVVDDNVIIIKLLTNMLKRLGVGNVVSATDGNEAVSKYTNMLTSGKSFSLVFMDQEMPNMNGNIATKKIIELDKSAIIIGLTGNAFKEQTEEFLFYGAKKVFTKPINLDTIKIILSENFRD